MGLLTITQEHNAVLDMLALKKQTLDFKMSVLW